MKRRKYALPIIAELKHIQIDLQRLQQETDRLASSFVDVRTANPALCDNHMRLTEQVYDNFQQVNLTELASEPMPYTVDIKERIRRREETLYNKPTEFFVGSYFEEIIRQFKAPAMRVRITKLEPGTEIPFHIDYDPTYATRIVVPVYSHPQVENLFRVRNEEQRYYLEPGKAYFLNTGFSHAVNNRSDQDRIALMFSLDGQEDLAQI